MSVLAGTAEELHSVQGQVTAGGVELVVNDQVTGSAMVLPHTSEAWTEAVYLVFSSSSVDGVKVALFEAGKVTAPGTVLPSGSFTVNVTLSVSTAELKVADTGAVIDVPVAPDVGEVEETVGGVVLAVEVSSTTSTQ
jgi:hypothetical protein